MTHELTATIEKVVEVSLDYDGTRLHENEEFPLLTETREWTCECGATFETESDAIDHLDEMNTHIAPGMVMAVTRGLRKKRPVERGMKANGFVVRGSYNRHYVGFDLEDGGHIVVRLSGQERTRHRSEPRLKTQTVYVVTAEFYYLDDLPSEPEDTREFADELDDYLDKEGEQLERGHTPAYMTDSVQDALDKTFEWYTVAQR